MPTRSINLSDKEQEQLLEGSVPQSVYKKVANARKPKSARYGKNKGANTQLEVADFIANLLGIPWDNQDDQSEIKARSMGLSGCDIILTGNAYKQFPFDVEVKAVETLSVPATIQQARDNTKEGRHWLIFWKKKAFDKKVVIMDIDAFKWLWNKT